MRESPTAVLSPDNRLFGMARLGRVPSAPTAIAVLFFTLVLALIPGQMLSRLIVPLLPDRTRSPIEPSIQTAAMFLPIYLHLWLWLRFVSRRPFRTLGLESRHAPRLLLRGALLGGLMTALSAGLSSAPGASLTPGLLQTMGMTSLGILSLLYYFVQGPAEELLFADGCSQSWARAILHGSACCSRRCFSAWLMPAVTV